MIRFDDIEAQETPGTLPGFLYIFFRTQAKRHWRISTTLKRCKRYVE